jgi:hypothetical protein
MEQRGTMDTTRLVTIRSFSNAMDADSARQHLESSGIHAFVRKDDYGGMQPYLQAAQGVFLEVHEKDRKKAGRMLELRGIECPSNEMILHKKGCSFQ